MIDTVLLVVDVQNLLIREHPYNERKVIENIKQLIALCRNNHVEVIYVRHNEGIGEELEPNTENWEIYHEIAPQGERIFDKHHSSAFLHTGLKLYLESRGIKNIILVGLQTEFCIDATLKGAVEHGFSIIIPEETNTTFDCDYLSGENIYKLYNHRIWKSGQARVLSMKDTEAFIGV